LLCGSGRSAYLVGADAELEHSGNLSHAGTVEAAAERQQCAQDLRVGVALDGVERLLSQNNGRMTGLSVARC
jgi:hypothetical protein